MPLERARVSGVAVTLAGEPKGTGAKTFRLRRQQAHASDGREQYTMAVAIEDQRVLLRQTMDRFAVHRTQMAPVINQVRLATCSDPCRPKVAIRRVLQNNISSLPTQAWVHHAEWKGAASYCVSPCDIPPGDTAPG